MLVLLWAVHVSGGEALSRSCCGGEYVQGSQESGWRRKLREHRWLMFAVLAGGFGANTNILLKACGEMAENVFFGTGADDDYAGYVPHLMLLGTGVCAVAQLMHLNIGASIAAAVKYFPVYNVALILLTTVVSLIYYEEYKLLSYAGMVAYPVGLIVVLFGILMLTWHPAEVHGVHGEEQGDEEDARAPHPKEEKEDLNHQGKDPEDKEEDNPALGGGFEQVPQLRPPRRIPPLGGQS
eukprot:TRINITY_DN406_c0_g1_i2.p1 TRINITY_DN406_c0_g1~~TRINITY_DN406_c0_g1_i2.p1  ORF type:complete len:238 (-),score=70.49 TRINITY_DN406_c0_g1_i2:483-1196(-)